MAWLNMACSKLEFLMFKDKHSNSDLTVFAWYPFYFLRVLDLGVRLLQLFSDFNLIQTILDIRESMTLYHPSMAIRVLTKLVFVMWHHWCLHLKVVPDFAAPVALVHTTSSPLPSMGHDLLTLYHRLYCFDRFAVGEAEPCQCLACSPWLPCKKNLWRPSCYPGRLCAKLSLSMFSMGSEKKEKTTTFHIV